MVRTLVILVLLVPACGVPRGTSEEERIEETFRDLLDAAAAARIVYLGETHDNPDHHALQERVLRAMWAADPRLAVGLEMFPREGQGALDEYVAGLIDEDELVLRTGCARRWGSAWGLAAPVLRHARESGIPLVALDLRPEVARRIGREGLEALTEAERRSLPEGPVVNEDHLRYIFTHDLELSHDLERLDHLVRAMVVRDDVMADSIVSYLEGPAGKDRRMVVLVGSGHVRRGLGIPERVARRTDWPQLVIMAEEFSAEETR